MKKSVFIFSLLFASFMFSQNLEEKISLEICNCIGNLEGAKNAEEKIENCFKKGFENNFFQISEKLSDSDGKKTNDLDDYANSIEGVLINNCTNFLSYAERDLRKPEKKSISYCTTSRLERIIMKLYKVKRNII